MHFPLELPEFLGEFCLGLFVGGGWALGNWIINQILAGFPRRAAK